VEAVDAEAAKAVGRTYLDFGFHVAITDPDSLDLGSELPALIERGVTSIKIFTAVEGWQLHRQQILTVMQAAVEHGLIVNVHAEDGPLATHLTSRLLAAGRRSVAALPDARPPESESIAVAIVSHYAEILGCPLYIVHLSCRRALEVTSAARARGASIYVETRPMYLYLDSSRYELPGSEGNKFVCWPPLRTLDDQQALWDGLATGSIQAYGTDHVPWTAAQMLNPESDFSQIPGGASNAQTSIGMLYSEGVAGGRISLRRFVELTSSNPAKLFGMWPEKGSLAVGADADVMLIDPNRTFRVVTEEMQSRGDLDPYDGWEGAGWPVLTMSRGEVVVQADTLQAQPGRGRFLARRRHEPL
jgi:dihydropyrimidinase